MTAKPALRDQPSPSLWLAGTGDRRPEAENGTSIYGPKSSKNINQKGDTVMRTTIKRFEDLEVWKEGMLLAMRVYQTMEHSRDFGLRDQMRRAAVSVPSNIAEGYERDSNKEFVHFLNYSRGSSGELRTQVYLAAKLGEIDPPTSRELLERSRKVSAMLHRYVQVRKRDF
jgi:four helix bundle protein